MSDIKPSSPSDPRSWRTWASVQSTEQLKKDKANLESLAQKNPSALLLASLCAFVKNASHLLFSRSLKGIPDLLDQKGIKIDLEALHHLLLKLSKADVSHEPTFIDQLSAAWHQLLKTLRLIELLERKESVWIKNLKAVLSQIGSYPSSSEHSLGFYFDQSVGEEWLPFPLMDMLRTLHEESIVKRHESSLQHWCRALEALLSKDS